MTSSETTFNDEELIARLRTLGRDFDDWDTAADRIEQLAVRKKALTKERDEQIEWVKRLADDLIAAEAKLATCEKYRDAYAECDRIGTQAVRDLEAKLAECEARLGKAVEALDYCINAPFSGWTIAQGYARTTLAEIKGESHE